MREGTIVDRAVLEAMEEGATVVTATRRLARAYRQEYGEYRRESGSECWDTPTVLPWEAWLRELWDRAQLDGVTGTEVLLGPDQATAVWERLVAASEPDLLDPVAAAAGAAEAWALLRAWGLDETDLEGYWSDASTWFAGWARSFERECDRHGWLPPARLPDRLVDLLTQQLIAPPTKLLLAGFDELVPQQTQLLDAVAAAGAKVWSLPLPDRKGRVRRTICHDDQDELTRAAAWARARLEENPDARIAVVVPGLEKRRGQLLRIFNDILQPRALLVGRGPAQPLYNVSLGRPLSDYPLIRAALRILRLLRGRCDAAELGALLRSPFVTAGEREADARAMLDARLRRRGELVVWLVDILRVARGSRDTDGDARTGATVPELEHAVQRLFVHHREATGKRTPDEWSILFSRALGVMGWPGERSLDSAEYQQLRAWEDLLDRFAGLGAVIGPLSRDRALEALSRLASSTVFQPRTPSRRLQVVGPLEALGQGFDCLWIAGLDDDIWPPAPRPNPWLPLEVQRRHDLPHADAARERTYIERLTARLLAAGDEVIVSYARWDGDRERSASPMIAAVPEAAATAVAPAEAHLLRDVVATADAWEPLEDVTGPPLESGEARGGAGALAAQAGCPMQAFGRYRLHARALETPRLGLDPRERGQLLHRSLELFYRRCDSADSLRRLDDGARAQMVRECTAQAVTEWARRRPRTFSERFREIEAEVLAGLLVDWLALEMRRPPFRVNGLEVERKLELAGATFSIKLDRIDELPDGRLLILDYKTGRVGRSDWEGERPRQPQLPLYALTAPEELAGVAFASIRPGATRLVGCADETCELPDVDADAADAWQDRRREWQRVLENLAADFVAGKAIPDPREPAVCRDCDLAGLCRIAEIRAAEGEASELEGTE